MKNRLQGWYRLNPIYGGILLCVLLVFLFYYYSQMVTPPSGLLVIEQVTFTSFVATDENRSIFPQLRSLPDDWLRTPTDTSEGWYQVTFNPAGLDSTQTAEGL